MNDKYSSPTPDDFPFGCSEAVPLLTPADDLQDFRHHDGDEDNDLRPPDRDGVANPPSETSAPVIRHSRQKTPVRDNLKNVTPDDERSGSDRRGKPGSAATNWLIRTNKCDEPLVRIQQIALDKLRQTVGKHPHERGGIFVSRVGPLFIEDFIFDDISEHEGAVYHPHAKHLNGILKRKYEPLGFFFVGVGHSHPHGFWHPSGHQNWGDVKAARSNLKSNENLDALFIPIIESQATTGTFRIHPFVMLRDGFRVCPARLEIVEGSQPVPSRSISLDKSTPSQKETYP